MFWLTIIAFAAISYSQVDAALNLDIKKHAYCPDYQDTPIKYSVEFKKLNDSAIEATGQSHVPFELGEDITFKIRLEINKDGEWKEFKKLEEKNPCQVFNKYGGDLWFDIQEAAGIKKGVCPLPSGDFKITNHVMNFGRLPVKSGPVAMFRSQVHLLKGSEVLLCLDIEVESK